MIRPLAALLAAGLTVWALLDLAQTPRPRVRGLPKPVWMIVVLLVPVLGPLAWLGLGRAPAPPSGGIQRPRPLAPDDDPEFLHRLDEERRRSRPDDPI